MIVISEFPGKKDIKNAAADLWNPWVVLHRAMKNRRREPGRDGKILSEHGQDGNVAVGGIGNLPRLGPSAASEIHKKKRRNHRQTIWGRTGITVHMPPSKSLGKNIERNYHRVSTSVQVIVVSPILGIHRRKDEVRMPPKTHSVILLPGI